MATPAFFNYEFYMGAKLLQMQQADPEGGWNMSKLVDAFAQNGFMGEDGAYEHFTQFGAAEDVAPNADFNASEYYAAKAAQFYGVEPKDVTELQIANVKAIINANGMNAWTHYQQFGSNEGVNPSNAFDADAYLAAKTEALIAAGEKQPDGSEWTAEAVQKAISDAGMTVLEHYMTYGGKGEGEVAEGVTFPVPDDQKVPSSNPGETFTLTTGVDTFVGGSGDDAFNATVTATSPVLGALDSIDGGAGNDTLNVADTAVAEGVQFIFPNGFTVKNVENINITTNGGISVDLSENADVTAIKGIAAGTAASAITASDSADVDLTVAGAATATVNGGKAVSVTGGTGATTVEGDGLTTVSVKGGGTVVIDNTLNGTTSTGTTLTSVVLDGVNASSTIKGEGLTDVTVKGATAGTNTVTITNGKADHALTVNVDGTGYDAGGTEKLTTVVDANATAITVNASGADSNLALTGSAAVETLNITGDAALKLKADDLNALTTIDGSAATGDLTLGDLNVATVNVKTGAGDDAFTIKAITKVAVDAGAGDDVVTLGAAIAAGSTINLGAGDDALLMAAGGSVAVPSKDATTVIDGGDGFDTVSAALINAANAAQFHNFEALDLSADVTNLDVALMTNSTLEALTLSGGSGTATVSNVAAGVNLLVSGANTGTTTINVKDAATGTADAFTVAFNGTAAADATATNLTDVSTSGVVVNGIENLSVESTGTGFVANTLKVTDDALQTLTITGDKDLTLTFGASGTNVATSGGAVKLIDGSAATGDLDITTTNVTADNKVGLTVKTGSGDDTIELAQKATVDAGAGDDTITASADGGTFTGGAGDDTFNVAAATLGSTTFADMVISTVTDFSAGDTLKMIGSATTITELTFNNTVKDLASALALATTTENTTVWFQYAGDTYIVANDASSGTSTDDLAVKLTGTGYNFDDATLANGALHLA